MKKLTQNPNELRKEMKMNDKEEKRESSQMNTKTHSISFVGTPLEMRAWICRLIDKYGKDARLIDVMFAEYGKTEVNLV